MGRAFVIVDVQRDLCEGGAAPVAGGAEVAGRILDHLAERADRYDAVVATREWHVDPVIRSAAGDDRGDDVTPHCVAGTHGARFHPALDPDGRLLHVLDEVFSKGRSGSGGTGFRGRGLVSGRSLHDWLRERGITAIDVAGVGAGGCDPTTALDGCRLGYEVRLFTDLWAAPAPDATSAAFDELASAGVALATSS